MIHHNLIKVSILGSMMLSIFLSSSLAIASDVYYYKDLGHIYGLKRNAISIADGYYTYSPTVKVFKLDGSKGSTDSLKKGQFVELTILHMDDKLRVDTIRRIPDPGKQSK